MLRRPLIIHEQNAAAGLTNRLLASFACRVLTGFPSVQGLRQYQWTGNPVREDLTCLQDPKTRFSQRRGAIRLLVLGGSQGARIFNQKLPMLIKDGIDIEVWHQCGNVDLTPIKQSYDSAGIDSRVCSFIDDMSTAYSWCDLVICRSGAMTVAEISCVGIAAIFVPFPYAVDDHQAKNVNHLVQHEAAYMIRQEAFSKSVLMKILQTFHQDRKLLTAIASKVKELAKPDATKEVANICLQVANA